MCACARVRVFSGGAEGLQEHMRVLLTAIKEATADRTATLRLEALLFLHALLESHAPEVFHPHMDELVAAVRRDAHWTCLRLLTAVVLRRRPAVSLTTGTRPWRSACGWPACWRALRALSARACWMAPSTLRPWQRCAELVPRWPGRAAHARLAPPQKLFAVVLPRLRAHDIDQEVKESAIGTIGVLVATFGDVQSDSVRPTPCRLAQRGAHLPPLHVPAARQLPDIMAVLRERLRNETTRTESLKALSEIARSPLRLSLGEFITPMLADLVRSLHPRLPALRLTPRPQTSFLRQSSRALRQAALESLVAIMRNETIHRGLDLASMRQMLAESALLIGDQDLHLSHYAIVLCIR